MESMDEPFILKFEYKGKPHILEVRPWIQQYKISYKVTVEEVDVTFEEDEEGQLRAIVAKQTAHDIDSQLIQEIAQRITDRISGQ